MKGTELSNKNLIDFLGERPSDKELILSSEDIDRKLKSISLDIRKEELESAKQDREERKKFADKIFVLLLSFLSASLLIVFLSGIKCLILSDTILVTLLTTTTVNVIGILS